MAFSLFMGLSLDTSAWVKRGQWTVQGPGSASCEFELTDCYVSENPADESPSVGDRIIIYHPDFGGVWVIAEIRSSDAAVVLTNQDDSEKVVVTSKVD